MRAAIHPRSRQRPRSRSPMRQPRAAPIRALLRSVQAAAHKTKSEIELLVAERFPRSEMLALVDAIPGSPPTASRDLLAPGQVCDPCAAARRAVPDPQAPGPVEPVVPRSKVTPVA